MSNQSQSRETLSSDRRFDNNRFVKRDDKRDEKVKIYIISNENNNDDEFKDDVNESQSNHKVEKDDNNNDTIDQTTFHYIDKNKLNY